MLKDINSSFDEVSINTCCKIDGEEVVFLLLPSAFPLDHIRRDFDVLFRENCTSVFCTIWDNCMQTAVKRMELTIDNIKTDIWLPTFKKCEDLLISIHDKSIKLTEMERYFDKLDDKEIESELTNLCNGVLKCVGNQHFYETDHKWISDSVNLMNQYWSLLSLVGAAGKVISLKEKLRLTGDFGLVETIASKVMFVHCIVGVISRI